MPEYKITRYELHAAEYVVQGTNRADAIKKVLAGQVNMTENSLEFVDFPEAYGLYIDGYPGLGEELCAAQVPTDNGRLPTIYDIEEN